MSVLRGSGLYSVKEAAEFLGGVSPYSIAAWSSKSQARLIRTKIGSRTFFTEKELLRFIASGGKAPATAGGAQ